MLEVVQPESIDEVVEQIRDQDAAVWQLTGAGTKPPLWNADTTRTHQLNLLKLAGVVDYQPTEFTITVLAGTNLRDVQRTLDTAGQYLPFDPPWTDAGATAGGTVAAGMNGPCRLRHGGVRDFMIGVKLVDGLGNLVTGGGRVVKNAAGFDLPKLVTGSCGTLGALVELTLKVFPKPESYCTLQVMTDSLAASTALVQRVISQPVDLAAVEIPHSQRVDIRLAGPEAATKRAAEGLMQLLKPDARTIEQVQGATEAEAWTAAREFAWVPAEGHALVKIPINNQRIVVLGEALASHQVSARYSAAGNVAWVAWPLELGEEVLGQLLRSQRLVGRRVRGAGTRSWYGDTPPQVFGERVTQALDPKGRFGSFR